jgi:hypothetical protein
MFLGLSEAGSRGESVECVSPTHQPKRCGHNAKSGEQAGKPACRPRSGVQGFDRWTQRQFLNQPAKFSVG